MSSAPRPRPSLGPTGTVAAEHRLLAFVWWAALACFVLAGATGLSFRLMPIVGSSVGLDPANVRHAHSHLMYFGWVTPLLMALVAHRLPGGAQRFRGIIVLTFVAALVAYPPFLLNGYEASTVAGTTLPLSVLGAALNGIAWWVFAARYRRARRGLPPTLVLRAWDAAVVFLVLASLGALGRGVVDALEVNDPFWRAAPIHAFLDLFAGGWFVFALLGLMWTERVVRHRWAVVGLGMAVVGLPLSFLLTVPVGLVPGSLRAVAGVSGAVFGAGLLVAFVGSHVPGARDGWTLPSVSLVAWALMHLTLVTPATASLGAAAGRVLYLHVLTLAVVSLGLVAAVRDTGIRDVQIRAWQVGVLAVLASLVPITVLASAPPGLFLRLWLPAIAAAVLVSVATVSWVRASVRLAPSVCR